ncbi:hypothetical protein AXZ95_2082 [Leifsonia sp. 115AMFTsu3.1]|nr:hypothetical protein AXZ95_2082 [Leifsonia sp. 115AMFTsu3.1]
MGPAGFEPTTSTV